MGSNGGNEIGALLGVGLGIAAGLKRRKEKKRTEAREDEEFALEKEYRRALIDQAKLNANKTRLEYRRQLAMGRQFTPEEEAAIAEGVAGEELKAKQLANEEKGIDVEVKRKDFTHYDEDRARNVKKDDASLAYMGAMTNRMNREPAGGAGSDGFGIDVNTSRALAAIKQSADVWKETHFDENTGEWDSEQSFRQWQGMQKQYLDKLGSLTGVPMPSGVDASGAEAGKAKVLAPKPQLGAPRPSDALREKGGERTYGEDVELNLRRPFEAVGEGMKSGWRWLTGASPDYVDEKGQAVDVSGLPTEQVKKMEAQGLIKRQLPLGRTGTGGYMGY